MVLTKYKGLTVALPGLLGSMLPSLALADELNVGDTAWILTATALVLFMTIPGLSLFCCRY
jgi:Amt family ammonium transporter